MILPIVTSLINTALCQAKHMHALDPWKHPLAELGGDQQVPWPPLWNGLTAKNYGLRLILTINLEKKALLAPPNEK
jgi:hypothetical protein